MELQVTPLCEGKTQKIVPLIVIQEATDKISAFDGKMKDTIRGKAASSATVSCNHFQFLKKHGIPVAFIERLNQTRFTAFYCDMLPYEVVARVQSAGSNFPPRRPDLKPGHRFDEPLIEFFLKTKDRRWKNHSLQCDDPLMRVSEDGETISLFLPDKPEEKPFLVLSADEVFTRENELELLKEMEEITTQVCNILVAAWIKLGITLVDFKLEFGIDAFGKLRLADVLDGDSGRYIAALGQHISKEAYRLKEALAVVGEKLALLAKMSFQLE